MWFHLGDRIGWSCLLRFCEFDLNLKEFGCWMDVLGGDRVAVSVVGDWDVGVVVDCDGFIWCSFSSLKWRGSSWLTRKSA